MRLTLALCLIALPAFCEEAAPDMPPRPVVSEIVNMLAPGQSSYVGTVAARTETDLGFPLIGTIAERTAETGDRVTKGEVLARLDPEDLDADLRAAEAGVDVATAQLRSATDAEARARALLARGVASETNVEDAQRALTAAQARLEQANAALERAKDIRSFATLTAPQDGVITQVFAEPGATLSAGEPIVRLAETDAREIVMDLTEQDIAGLEPGAPFLAVLAANPGVTAAATLSRIDPIAERSTRTRRLHLTLSAPPTSFRLGALVRVSAAATSGTDASIALGAVLDPGTDPAVWRVDRTTNTVARTPVTLGETFGQRVRVTRGLDTGDEVVIKGIHSLQDGQIVGPRVTP